MIMTYSSQLVGMFFRTGLLSRSVGVSLVLSLSFCGMPLVGNAETAVAFSNLPTQAWSAVIPAEKNLPPEWENSLFTRGVPRTYEGDALMKIGMPVGGVCAGLVYLGGDGKLWWWDIFNRGLNGVQPRQIQYKGRDRKSVV